MSDVDCVVVGAGVVGLSVACAEARAGRSVLVLEAAERAGEGISSRNSGVIHAGMYYPTGSLKARLCVRGLQRLYAWCGERGVAHRRLGKLIVACTPAELPALRALGQRAADNGVRVHWLEAEAARALEPELRCAAALLSPDSGIVDVPELITSLEGELQQHSGQLVTLTAVDRIECAPGQFRVHTAAGDALSCRRLINAAGLGAVALAARSAGLAPHHVPRLHYGQGHYYGLHGRAPFQRLIYPLPGPASLGVHLGMDLGGRVRFGPDMRWVAAPDYRFDDSQREAFARSIQQWWPALDPADLLPDFVGVRPKLHGPGEAQPDFLIQDASTHGIPGLINLFGIESPGLTSALAIGDYVQALDP